MAGFARATVAEHDNDPHRQRARAQPEEPERRHPARQVHRRHRRQRLGQEHAGLRHPVQRRPAALPRIAQRLRAQHRAAGRPARGRRGLRHPAHGGDRAAASRGRAQEHGGHPHRGLALCACSTSSWAPALRARRRRCAAERREHRGADPAHFQRPTCRPAGAAGGHRKGVYTDLAKWAKARPHAPASTASSPPPASRASTASRNTPSSCRWRPVVDARRNEAELREGAWRRWSTARACCILLHRSTAWRRRWRRRPLGRPRIGRVKVFSTKRACPVCGTSYPEPDPRLFSLQQQTRLVPRLRRHRAEADARAAQGADDSVRERDDDQGREQSFPAEGRPGGKGLVDEPARAALTCHGARR